jgi:hypothetical protein
MMGTPEVGFLRGKCMFGVTESKQVDSTYEKFFLLNEECSFALLLQNGGKNLISMVR